MEALEKSYEYHSELETFTAFVRREWKAVLFFGGGFCVVMLAAVFLVDPAFFYPRLQTDPLNYWLKVQKFVESGTTAAQWSVNTRPFPYAAMPGLLRAPALVLFHDFDNQLRAIQIANIPIVGGVALLSAYIFSWCMPGRRHALVIAAAFAFVMLSPVWIANVFLPLADAPYAFFTLAALVVAVKVLCSPLHLSRQVTAIIAFVALFGVAFALRFTAPALLVFAALLARGHWHKHSLSRGASIALGIGVAALLLLLVQLNHQAIFGRYFAEPLIYLRRGNPATTLLSLLGVSLPAQVVPNFVTGFAHPPIMSNYKAVFSLAPMDLAWLALGLAISSVMIIGAWLVRRRFLPEIVYVLLPLPVLGAILPSTTRYLITYQPFLWIFFFTGAVYVGQRTRLTPLLVRHRVAAIVIALALAGSVVSLRVARTLGTASERNMDVSLAQTPAYVGDVARTFRGLRGFLERLPRDSALLIGDHGLAGRWKAISGLSYYIPDSALSRVAATRPVYVLAECGTLEVCTGWDWYRGQIMNRVTRFGSFEFDSVFAAQSNRAKVEVYRLRPGSH